MEVLSEVISSHPGSEPRMRSYLLWARQSGVEGWCALISFPLWGGAGSKDTDLAAMSTDTGLGSEVQTEKEPIKRRLTQGVDLGY